MTEITTATVADVWRDPEDPRWKSAHNQITGITTRAFRNHRTVKTAPFAEKQDLIDDLTSAFWVHLVENRAALEASRVHGEGAIYVEAMRFADKQISPFEGNEEREMLRRHLHKKVSKVLREEATFRELSPRLWSLAEEIETSATGTRFLSESEILASLPVLSSVLKAQRAGQLPPLVRAQDLQDFLECCLKTSRRPETGWGLTGMTWKSLAPPPEVLFTIEATAPNNPEHLAVNAEWNARIDAVAGDFVDSLDDRVLRIVVLHDLQGLSFRQIEESMDVSRSAASQRWGRFKKSLAQLCKTNELDEHQGRQLLEVIRDILEVESFLPGEKEFDR